MNTEPRVPPPTEDPGRRQRRLERERHARRLAARLAARGVHCPACAAKPGDYCATASGRTATTPHVPRIRFAAQIAAAQAAIRRHLAELKR
jgi:ferritin-like protein